MDFFIPPTDKELGQRKRESYEKYSRIIKEGRRNPIWFANFVYGIEFYDAQRYTIMNTWTAEFAAWLQCRGSGKTTMLDVYSMLRMELIPYYKIWVTCNTAGQSAELFKSLEDIVLKRNPAFTSLTSIFADEIEIGANSQTGFIHDPGGYRFKLHNSSELTTLSSNLEAIRGKRGSIISDESMGMTVERAAVVDLFATTKTDFGLGVNELRYTQPPKFPLQMIYASSAGDVSSPWWEKYSLYAKRMLLGDRQYFACDINADVVLNKTTVRGIPTQPHLRQDVVDKMMREDPERGERELYNRFRKGAGDAAIVSLDTLMKNSHDYMPVFGNDTGKRRFVLCYDPARNMHNSILMIGEIIFDDEVGYKARIVNTISMTDTRNKKKTPLPMNEQVDIIKQALIDYNGDAPEWDNIDFYIDAGAGGGGVSAVADSLLADWQSNDGKTHRGLIDIEHNAYATSRQKYINAIPKIHLVEPHTWRNVMYGEFEKFVNMDLIEFSSFDGKEFIVRENKEGELIEEPLSPKERIALEQCELAKTEMSYIVKAVSDGGSVSFGLQRDKRNVMNDDRSYTLAMVAHALAIIRRTDLNHIEEKPLDKTISLVTAIEL